MNNPFVSVVMPNYNGQKFIRQAIESVIHQTYQSFELLVVDDKSTDNSVTIIKEYCKNDNRIKLIQNEKNQGVSTTRNIGIKAAKGDYIALLDNDDMWELDKLERQVSLIKTGADIIYCSYDFCDENDAPIKKPFVVPKTTSFKKMLSSSVISCSTCFIKANLMKDHPFNPDYYHEDYVLWMELLRLPVQAVGDQKVLMHYRQISGSRSNNKKNAAKERWNTYRVALKLNFFVSVWAFIKYTIKGVQKYYF